MSLFSSRPRLLQYSVSVPAGTTSDPVFAGAMAHPITVTASPSGGGTAKIQISISTEEAINAGSAVWIDWDDGAVSAATARALTGPVTAVRCVAVTGTATMEVAGHKR